MGRIYVSGHGEVPLRAHHLIGRSRAMHTSLASPDVSGQHLALVWDGRAWHARDLASRNGTALGGVRLRSGDDAPLDVGAVLELGSDAARVVLVDAAPPAVLAVCGDVVVEGEADLLALPDADDPEVLVVQDAHDGWVCTTDDDRRPVADGDVVEAGGARYTLGLPDVLAATADVGAVARASDGVALDLRVSADEEYVEVTVLAGDRAVALPPRAHHEVLLALARVRLDDGALADAEQGWIYRDTLRRHLQMTSNQLYVSVHRLRRELEDAELLAGDALIEQRRTTRQLRLGVRRVTVAPL